MTWLSQHPPHHDLRSSYCVRLGVLVFLAGAVVVSSALLIRPSMADVGRAEVTGSLDSLPVAARTQLEQILYQAGLREVKARSVERSPKRQVAVMLALVEEDAERAKAMYCDAGDTVLDSFDPQRSRKENEVAMLRTLLAELPRAREMGCLNHVENDDVISVDIRLSDVAAERHEKLVEVAEQAVRQKRLARFLAPPREPDAFHFEFLKTALESSATRSAPEDGAPKGSQRP